MTETIFHIDWAGPYSPDNIPEDDEQVNKAVLYQVYGTYHSYNQPCLLYIGKTERTVNERIPEHSWVLGMDYHRQISDSKNIELYFGTINIDPKQKSGEDTLTEITKCESLLIFAHKPVFNIKEKNNLPENSDLRIFNWNNFRNLMPEVSALRWSDKFWDNEKWNKMEPVFEMK